MRRHRDIGLRRAAQPFAGADTFIKKNCASCHNPSAPATRLDLTQVSFEPANPDNFATWVKVHDRVSAGEMPPAYSAECRCAVRHGAVSAPLVLPRASRALGPSATS